MEKKFYTDNFEQLLKETTDNFRMYPSKRVWHGIYNDLHPSRRWPSLAVWLLLISSVVFIGLSNKNQVAPSNSQTNSINEPSITASVSKKPNTTQAAEQLTGTGSAELNSTQQQTIQQVADHTVSNNDIQRTALFNNSINNKAETVLQQGSLASNDIKDPAKKSVALLNIAGTTDKDLITELDITNTGLVAGSTSKVISPVAKTTISMDDATATTDADLKLLAEKTAADKAKKTSVADKANKNTDIAWVEDYAFHNKPSASKWKTHVVYQLYFTPSVGYRTLSKNTNFNPISTALVSPAGNVQDYKDKLSQAAAINLELGGNILYSISKNWNIKAGVQFNYTNYGVLAYELKHPTTTTLLLKDLNNGLPILDPRSTNLANTTGVSSKKLNNNTYQVSIPIGADIRIAGKNNLKWYAGATIQPTYIIGGNSYLISSDLKNYVADNSLMRRWNLNAGIETFISYKTKGGIIVNAGPQFRYQVMSTYSKQYTYDEKLYNIGLKIGITTKF